MVGIFVFALSTLLISGSARADVENFLAVDYKCPEGNGGKLESILQNGEGVRQKIRVSFADGKPTRLGLELQLKGKPYEEKKAYVFDGSMSKEDKFRGDSILEKTMWIQDKICKGTPAARKKYKAELKKNKRELREIEREMAAKPMTATEAAQAEWRREHPTVEGEDPDLGEGSAE